MNKTQFHKQLLSRYKNNEASLEEIELLFHLIKTGEITDLHANQSDFVYQPSQTKTDLPEQKRSAGTIMIKRFSLLKVAAAILLMVSVSSILYRKKEEIRDMVDPVRIVRVEVPYGRMRKLQLSDGTEVWLNAGSSLKYPEKFNRDQRVLTLQGEAFFKVFHDAEKPFIIRSGNLNTVVLGTSFNVRTYKDSPAQVSVRSGKVSVAEISPGEAKEVPAKQCTVVLTKDQQATYLGNKGFTIRENVPAGEYMGWQSGELSFTGKTLAEMTPVLERWYGVRIEMESSNLANCRMVGSYRQETLENVLEAMRFALNITYKIEGKHVTIRGGSCK